MMNASNESRHEHGQIDQRVVIGVVIVALIAVGAIWFLTRQPAPEPVPRPGGPVDTVAPAETGAERGDTARQIIEELSSAKGGPDYAGAYERAQEFQQQGRFADAQLLYFFAARGGHAPAAFDLATFYDPNHHSEASSLMDEPDPFQAYRWYEAAAEAGDDAANQRLTELRSWAEKAAADGDAEAERLLLQWE